MNKVMFKKLATAIGPALLMLSAPANAGEAGLTLQVEPMYMKVFGNDQKVGDINTTTFSQDMETGEFLSSTTSEPINLDMDGAVTFRGEIQYLKNRWGIGTKYIR